MNEANYAQERGIISDRGLRCRLLIWNIEDLSKLKLINVVAKQGTEASVSKEVATRATSTMVKIVASVTLHAEYFR